MKWRTTGAVTRTLRRAVEPAAPRTASAVGARLIYADNLYAYGRVSGPLTEDLPYRPVSPNTRTQAEVAESPMKPDADGRVRATIGRDSDFFCPHVMNSSVGVRVFGRLLQGKPAQVLGTRTFLTR
jgi:hypothetical protein